MNYIQELKSFYGSLQTQSLSSGQILLWNALMSICNELAWSEWFTAPSRTLELRTGMSIRNITRARDALRDRGFIDYQSRGTRPPLYRMIPYSERSVIVHMSEDVSEDMSEDVSEDVSTLNKRKHKRTPPIVPPKGRTKRVNPAAHGYQQREYGPGELDYVFADLDGGD